MRWMALTALALAAPPALAAQDGALLDKVRTAMNLPVRTAEARDAGVPDERVRSTVWDIFRSGVPAEDATRIFDEEVRIVREGGSKDNFGAFVRSRVEAGLRGRELAEAIHAEHARRGMGKPAETGKPGTAGKPGEAGKRGGPPQDRAQEARDDDGQQGQAQGKKGQSGQGQDQGQGRKP